MTKFKYMGNSIEIKDNEEIDVLYNDALGGHFLYKLDRNSFEVFGDVGLIDSVSGDFNKIYDSVKKAVDNIKSNNDVRKIIIFFNRYHDKILENDYNFIEKQIRRLNEKRKEN